ncbi:MAG: Hg(II)-responsive transcriptional regulator MerR [Gammaproteobacteria bacterium]
MKISKLAQLTGTSSYTIRHYVECDLLHPTRDPDNNYQIFTAADIARVNFIQQAKKIGCSLKEIHMILAKAQQNNSPCPKVRQILKNHIAATKTKIIELQQTLTQLETIMETWSALPDGAPDGNSVCYLIEKFTDRPKLNND